MNKALLFAIGLAALVALSVPVSAVSYSVTVHTDSAIYVGSSSISITGQVSPAPGANTSVLLRVYNPSMVLVGASEAPVNGTTGSYSYSFVAGGTSSWVAGTYTVNATWGAYGPAVFQTATFSWSPLTTSTTSTSTTSSSSTTTSTTSSTTTSSTTTSSTTSSSFTTTSSTTSVTSSSSATSSTSVPEFPFQMVAVVVTTVLLASAFLIMRSRTGHTPDGRPR